MEHSILLLATYELFFQTDLPFQIVINEAIEIDKILGSNDGYKMINAVLNELVSVIKK